MSHDPAFDDIPGTILFDAERSRQGYHLNMFCMSLMKAENRDAFRAGERAYLAKFPMTDEQRQSILDRDWNGMLELGGNIYYTAKLAACDGLSFQQIAAIMTGSTQDDYAKMMLEGGRPPEGNRTKSEWQPRCHSEALEEPQCHSEALEEPQCHSEALEEPQCHSEALEE